MKKMTSVIKRNHKKNEIETLKLHITELKNVRDSTTDLIMQESLNSKTDHVKLAKLKKKKKK